MDDSKKKLKFLLIENSQEALNNIRESLCAFAEVDVVEALTLKDAVVKFNNHTDFDLIVTDFRLDGSNDLDGLQFARLARRAEKDVPIIGVSHYLVNGGRIDASDLDRFIHKADGYESQITSILDLANGYHDLKKNAHDSVFISYGGPDTDIATAIDNYLTSKGVRTWFFPRDAIPGQKLHRAMWQGVNAHDRVLLICSESSLARSGVLNEVERVLERESTVGGAAILIPVSIDDFVFTWKPERPDVAAQILSRVIARFPTGTSTGKEFVDACDKLLGALRR